MADDAPRIAQLEAEVRGLRAENAALHADAERRDRTLAEAREQQTATTDILRIVASSPTDLHAVLDAVLASAVRLSAGELGSLWYREGGHMRRLSAYPADRPASAASRGRERTHQPGQPLRAGDPRSPARSKSSTRGSAAPGTPTRSSTRRGRSAGGPTWPSPCSAGARRSARSPSGVARSASSTTTPSPCWRASPIKPSSPSRMPACSKSWSTATATWVRRWSSRPRRPTSSGSSPRHPQIYRSCSTPSPSVPLGSAMAAS